MSILLFYSWAGHDDGAEPIRKEYYVKAQKDESWIEKLVSDPVALFTLILTGATVGLYLATRSLFVATEKLVIGADKASERQLRAYVLFTKGYLLNVDAHAIPKAVMVIKNFGNTPAEMSRVWATLGLDYFPPRIPFPLPEDDFPQFKSIIGPGQEINITASFAKQLSAHEYGLLENEWAAIYAIIQCEYTDVFRNKQSSRFELFAHGLQLRDIEEGRIALTSIGSNAT